MPRLTTAVRAQRTKDRITRRATLQELLGRIERLSTAELALLVEYVHAELDASDALRSTQVGMGRALEDARARTQAAEAAILEAERDRDRLAQYLAATRQACGAPTWPDVPATVRRLTTERTRYAPAYRSARARAARGRVALQFAEAVAELADAWFLGTEEHAARNCGRALLSLLDQHREHLWPSA